MVQVEHGKLAVAVAVGTCGVLASFEVTIRYYCAYQPSSYCLVHVNS